MILTHLSVEGFKNLHDVDFSPHEKYNLILGENAQGKTNLLEAIWSLTGCRSFRGTRERDYLPFDGGDLCVKANIHDARREQEIMLRMVNGNPIEKKFWCNGVVGKSGGIFSLLQCIAFIPEDIYLVTGSPQGRRSFLDLCAAQLSTPLMTQVRRYQLILQQRNAYLKQRPNSQESDAMLSVWDGQLSTIGYAISVARAQYAQSLGEVTRELYARITRGREEVTVRYISDIYGRDMDVLLDATKKDDLIAQYTERLKQTHENDRLMGHTTSGVHRDELSLLIAGKSAKEFGSQGQKKSLALALKLAQAQIYGVRQKEPPIILLDDVLGELDEKRQAVIATIIEHMQVFVTTPHPESIMLPFLGKKFMIADGYLRECTEK